jgi:formylglycine-generating enzyme required for sulfatase activity
MRIQITILPIILAFIISFHAQASEPEIDFVTIPSGHFIMGSSDLEEALFEIPPESKLIINDEQPAHNIFLSTFEIGKYEVTQQQWLSIMGTRPGPDKYWQHSQWKKLPVVSISWNMTQTFINKLNSLSTTYHYRLPTEAEFEYVLRAGSDELRPFDIDQMDQYAWTITNSGDVPHPVGLLEPNAYGVYDTFGNVWEWVNDWYHAKAYSTHKTRNPQGPDESTGKKVRRGGSYHCPSHLVRSGYRAADKTTTRYSVNGFRLVREKR